MPLSPEQSQLLDLMRQDNASAGWPFCASECWITETASFNSAFKAAGINNVEDEFYNTRFSGITQDDFRLYGWFLWTYYQLVRQRDVLGLFDRFESTLSEAPAYRTFANGKAVPVGVPIVINGRKISADLIFSIDDFYNIYELMPDIATKDGVVVADLGAGWGRLGHVLLQVNPGIKYVIFDIPEPLLVSSTYLPGVLPDFSFSSYGESRALEKIDREMLKQRSIWFFGAQHIEDFSPGSVDVMVNIASFQEMTIEQVNCYLDIFGKVARGGYIYLRNEIAGAASRVQDYQLPRSCAQVYQRLSRFSQGFIESGYRVR
jgi:hypothetical protein